MSLLYYFIIILRPGDLKRHINRIHENVKDYKCDYCEGSLKKHIYIVHEGHKDYECESCDKSFSHEQNLKRHIKTIH